MKVLLYAIRDGKHRNCGDVLKARTDGYHYRRPGDEPGLGGWGQQVARYMLLSPIVAPGADQPQMPQTGAHGTPVLVPGAKPLPPGFTVVR